jgi:hypothetical protein
MIFPRRGIKGKIKKEKKRNILIKKGEFRELLSSPRINNPVDETLP